MTALRGRAVLITGAAHGIGAATARSLAGRGARLVLLDLDADTLARTAAGLDAEVLAVPADVSDLAAVEAAVAAGLTRFGGLDAVVANAGIASYGSTSAVDPVAFRRVVEVNLLGVFHTVRAALPAVVERRGYVLAVSSMAAFAATPGLAAYSASKAGVERFADALRLEVAHLGVDVGSAHMSWVDTPLVREAREDLGGFGEMVRRLPGPMAATVSAERCAEAFVRGIERRDRRVYVPRWVGLLSALRPVLAAPALQRRVGRDIPAVLGAIDEQTTRLGRAASARTVSIDPVLRRGGAPRGPEADPRRGAGP